MMESEITNVGCSERAHDLLKQFKEQELFAEMLDGYRFAISYAAALGVVPPEFEKRKTWLNIGSLDPDQLIRSAIEALYEDQLTSTTVYRLAERLADWGVREMYEQHTRGELDFAGLLKSVEDASIK